MGVRIEWSSRHFAAPEIEEVLRARMGNCENLTLFVAFRGTIPVTQFLVPNELRARFVDWYRPDASGSLWSSFASNLDREGAEDIAAMGFERTKDSPDWAKLRDSLKARVRH